MGRSIGAVIVGFLYALATIWLTQMILWFAFPEDPATEAVPTPRLVLTVVCTFLAAFVAGFMAAHVAPQGGMVHALVVGAILVILLGVTTLYVETEPAAAWYQLALPLIALPGTLFGAALRVRVRRPPPPTPPSAD